jgi:hypothetical protein
MFEERLNDIWILLKPVSDELGIVDKYTLHVKATCHDYELFSLSRFKILKIIKLSTYMNVDANCVYNFRLEAHIDNMSSISAYSNSMFTLQNHETKGFKRWPIWLIVIVSLASISLCLVIIILIVLIRDHRHDKPTSTTIPIINTSRHYINPNYESAHPSATLTSFTNPTYNVSNTTISHTDGSINSDEYGKYDILPYEMDGNGYVHI